SQSTARSENDWICGFLLLLTPGVALLAANGFLLRCRLPRLGACFPLGLLYPMLFPGRSFWRHSLRRRFFRRCFLQMALLESRWLVSGSRFLFPGWFFVRHSASLSNATDPINIPSISHRNQ